MITRRVFLSYSCVPLLASAGIRPAHPFPADRLSDILRTAPKARYWATTATASDCISCHPQDDRSGSKHDHKQVRLKCLLCAQGCVIAEGERGRCRARMNVRGELRSLVYGRPVTFQVDPIEKKPFYHFLPGAEAFSLATSGCPLRCRFCQNWQISQSRPEDFDTRFVSPDEVGLEALRRKSPIVAFTYNEPTVFTEYLTDIARAGKPKGLRHVLISCGFMNPEPLAEMCRVLDAIKIDLKGFDESFYRNVSQAELQPVLRSIKQIAKSRVHLEIVNLVVPTLNDSEAMLKALASWIFGELGPDVPIHFTRFHPDYQLLNLPPTPVSTLEKARETAMAQGIRYAYVGNVPGHSGNHTFCPRCGKIVIKRSAFIVDENHVKGGKCSYCGQPIPGVWS
jgi:pyruvate formate lyase activating enzyme